MFDVMDTLFADPYREAHEAATGLTFQAFEALRPSGAYHALERSEIDEPAYWDALRKSGMVVDVDKFHSTRRAGYRWLPGMRELLMETAARHRVVLASNYPALWFSELRSRFFHDMHLDACASGDIGVRKPSLAFFARVMAHYGLEPATTVLIDDSEANIDGARVAGWHGLLFRGAAATREAMRHAFIGEDR